MKKLCKISCFIAIIVCLSFLLLKLDAKLDYVHKITYDYHVGMMTDLKGDIRILYKQFANPKTSKEERWEIVEKLLYKLAKAEDIDENSRGEYVNAKHLKVVEYFMNKNFYSTYEAKHNNPHPENPNLVAGAMLESAYEKTKMSFYGQMASNTVIKHLLMPYSFNFIQLPRKLVVLSPISLELKSELLINTVKAKNDFYYLSAYLKGYGLDNDKLYFDPFDDNCLYTLFTKNDRELKWQIDSMGKILYDLDIMDELKQGDEAVKFRDGMTLDEFHARRGDDVVYGAELNDRLIGGSGDDILDGGDGDDALFGWQGKDIIYGGNGDDKIYGGEDDDIIIAGDGDDTIYPDHNEIDENSAAQGNDIINAGKGNDIVYSILGDDTYIYNLGDGNDIIYDNEGVDVIYFGDNITPQSLDYEKIMNDLVIKIENSDDSITIKNWFEQNKDCRIEYFNFKDTQSRNKRKQYDSSALVPENI